MSGSALRLAGVGALAGLLAGIFVAIPLTAVAHAVVLTLYQPAPWQLAKATCCGQVLPGFWSQVIPDLTFGPPLVRALLGLMSGAAFGILYAMFHKLAPGPTLLKAVLFGIVLALPNYIFVPANGAAFVFELILSSPWESAFSFLGPLGTVPAYNMPLEFRLLLALPVAAAGLGIAALAQSLDTWLPGAGESRILTPIYAFLTAIACLGLLVLPLKATLLLFGGD